MYAHGLHHTHTHSKTRLLRLTWPIKNVITLANQRNPLDDTRGTSIVVRKVNMWRRTKMKHLGQKSKSLEWRLRVRMQLSERHVKHTKHAHIEFIKRKTNNRVREHAHIDVKKVIVVTFSAMAHVVYRRTTFNKHLGARVVRCEHRHTCYIRLHHRRPPISREAGGD